MLPLKKTALALGCVAALTACGHMPVTGLVALRNFDAATFDPAALRLAMQMPDAIAPRRHGVKLEVTLWSDVDAAHRTRRSFVLEETIESDVQAALAPFARAGRIIHAYRVAPKDVAVISALQAQGIEMGRQHPGQNHLAFGAGMEACRLSDMPTDSLPTTTLLSVTPQAGFVELLRDFDLKEEVRKAGKDVDRELQPCTAS